MRVLRIFLLLTSFTILTSSASSSITVEAKLLGKFKVDLADQDGFMEFLKFKILETEYIFLINPHYDIQPRKFYKKHRVYKITYGEGGLWNESQSKIELDPNEELDKYPVHYMLEIERIK